MDMYDWVLRFCSVFSPRHFSFNYYAGRQTFLILVQYTVRT
jgi:hypothetical protein